MQVVENDSIECLSPQDIMKLLGISRAAAYRLFNTDNFPSFTVGERCLRVTKRDFKAYLEKQKKK